MIVSAAEKAMMIVTLLHSPRLAAYGLSKLADRTRGAALKAIGGDKDPHGVLKTLREQVGANLSQNDAVDLLLELTSDSVAPHIRNLAELTAIIGPNIAAIVADLQASGVATATTAAAALAVSFPMLPPAP
jgi:hypothetical protein